MISTSKIDKATELLLTATPAGSRVILFGSQAAGTADDRSDVDFLVIEDEVNDRVGEMLRLSELLRPLRLPADVLVLSRLAFERWKDTPNSIAYRASREGKMYGQQT